MSTNLRKDVNCVFDFVYFTAIDLFIGLTVRFDFIEFGISENLFVVLSDTKDGLIVWSQILLVIGMCSRPLIKVKIMLEHVTFQ